MYVVQLLDETTRHDKNTLDLIFTNNQDPVHSIKVEKTSLSDHDIVHMTLLNSFSDNQPTVNNVLLDEDPFKSLNLYKANWDQINKELNQIDWEILFPKEDSVDRHVELLEEKSEKF